MSKLYLSFGLIAILILISLTVFISATKDAVSLKADSPERTVQNFLQYLSEERFQESYDLISPSKKNECGYISFVSSITDIAEHIKNNKIQLKNTYAEGDEAIVSIRVSEMNYSILSAPSENSSTKQYGLILSNNQWLIETMEYPNNCLINKGTNLE